MDDECVRKLLEYLSHFGQAKFLKPDFTNPKTIDFAGIELITTEPIAKGLVSEINSHLTIECGSRAFLRYITYSEIKDGRYKYVAEILPYSFVHRKDWMSVTEDVLRILPRIIRNYRMKNPSRT